jgi:hypothetical protein
MSQSILYSPRRRGSSIPLLPQAPVLQPARLPSITEPAPPSWRLSFSAEKRGEELRKLSQNSTFPITVTTELLGSSPAPLNKWLHSQGLRSVSQVVKSNDYENPESVVCTSPTCSTGQDFGGVDGVGDPGNLHLHEMGISMRLASSRLDSSSSSPQLSNWESNRRGFSSLSGSSQFLCTVGQDQNHSSDSAPLSQNIPLPWGAIQEVSSTHASVEESALLSPGSSQFSLIGMLTGTRNKTPLLQKLGMKYSGFLSLHD